MLSSNSIAEFLINSGLGRVLNSIIRLINRIIPKRENQILFESIPDISDNPFYLYSYMKELGEDYRFVWVVLGGWLLHYVSYMFWLYCVYCYKIGIIFNIVCDKIKTIHFATYNILNRHQ